MAELNIGLIGAGRIARVHAETLAYRIPGVKLVAVADVIEDAAKKLAADFNIPAVYNNAQPIFDDKRINAVIICSSTDSHAKMMEDAATAGKHIFCEKPIALDLAKIDHALDVVKKSGVKLQLGFNRRFDPSFRKLREMVTTGKIGTPHILKITSRDPAPPPIAYVKVSGGLFLDMTIHDFDMARFLLGDVQEVYAAAGVMVDPEIGKAGDVDTAIITLKFKNGAIGVIDNSRQAVYGYDQRIEVFGSGGVAMANNKTPDMVVSSDDAGVHSAKPLHFFVERYADAYIAEMQEFVRCVIENKQPSVTSEDGRAPVVIGYAVIKSVQENRPVKLSEIK
jgi:myo-inositol 2-dehydrogenase / D-chiro-inositol 1-dehydrogenase